MEDSENATLHKPYQHNQEDENVQLEEDDDQEEEALSLSDLPLDPDQPSAADHPNPAAELFEFLSSATCDVSPAENIIFRGKLIPLNDRKTFCFDRDQAPRNNNVINPHIRVRSESLSALQGDKLSRSSSLQGVMRNSRSLDCRKLTCASSNESTKPPDQQDRKSPEKGSSPPQPPKIPAAKGADTASFGGRSVRPRWYVIMFGMVKFPPETELRDIKIRQTRRNLPPVMFPSPGDRSSGKYPSSSWRFLKALSCKEPTSVAATAPCWVPHA